jgi:hypothetical protein
MSLRAVQAHAKEKTVHVPRVTLTALDFQLLPGVPLAYGKNIEKKTAHPMKGGSRK